MTDSDSPAQAVRPLGRVLVFGASGYVGRHLVARLAARGIPVRAAARRAATMAAENWGDGVEIVRADALDPRSLPRAMEGIDTAFYLVHSMASGRGFPALDLEAAGHFAEAAAAAGVGRIVYLGGLVPADAESPHLLSRRATGERLREGPVPVVELRAGIIVGPGSAAFEVMRDLVAHLPIMVTPRWVRSASPPIALDDLLFYLEGLATAAQDAVEGKVFDSGGPETLSYETMMRRMAPLLGRRVPMIVPAPVLTPELSAYWLRFVTSTPANVATALVMGLRHDILADDAALRALLPRERMDFETAVRAVLRDEAALTVGDRWREGALALRRGRHDVSFYGKRHTVEAVAEAPPLAVWDALQGVFPAGGPIRELAAVAGRRLVQIADWPEPGASGIEIEIEAHDGGSRIAATLHFQPLGFYGLLWWYGTYPLRRLVLQRRLARVVRAAEGNAQNISRSASGSVG